MKRVCFLSVLTTLILASCNNSPTDKANRLIREELPKYLPVTDSYDPVETLLDSAFAPYDDPDFYNLTIELSKMRAEMYECRRKTKEAESSMMRNSDFLYSTYSKYEYKESKVEFEKCTERQKTMEDRVKKRVDKIRELLQKKPEFIGFRAIHRFRINYNAGPSFLKDVLYILNKDFSEIIAFHHDIEEYEKFQQLVEQIQEDSSTKSNIND